MKRTLIISLFFLLLPLVMMVGVQNDDLNPFEPDTQLCELDCCDESDSSNSPELSPYLLNSWHAVALLQPYHAATGIAPLLVEQIIAAHSIRPIRAPPATRPA